MDLKKQVYKSRERDYRGLSNRSIPPLIEKAPKQEVTGRKEF